MEKKDVDRRVLIAGLGGAMAGSLLAGNAMAGSLNPPQPGPPAPSGKDLSTLSNMIARTDQGCSMPPIPIESLPGTASVKHLITASGSYYQVGNIVGNPGQDVIGVQASNVDICGGGFHIFVPGNPTGLPSGVGMVCTGENVTFYDGSVLGGRVGLDFAQASRFLIWDVISIDAQQAAFMIGSFGNLYDSEAHRCQGVGMMVSGSHTLIEEGAAITCGTGYVCTGAQNLFIQNVATDCGVPFAIGPGNSYGPIVNVVGVGDISSVPNNAHPWANIVH